jgi:outer membrane protein OmpA-like peptidoglycan-associated protein/tetratricopeptide (TPR) repeat protein
MKKALLIIFFLPVALHAQNYSTNNKKAIEYFERAFGHYNAFQYKEAVYWAEAALEKDDHFTEVYYLLSDIYGEVSLPEKKIHYLKKAVEINPQKNALAFYTLAKTELSIGNYKDAEVHFLELKDIDQLNVYTEFADSLLRICRFGLEAIKNPVSFKPVNAGETINSEFDEYLPTLTADEKLLIYTRLVPTGTVNYAGEYEFQEDFYISQKKDDAYLLSKPMDEPLNTYSNEGAQSISADGRILLFTSCNDERGKNPHGKAYGSCDIFISYKLGDKWSKPRNIGPPVNSKYWESQPSFSADGKTLYYTSDRPGGKGGMDIWMTQMKPDSSWMIPENCGEMINTSKHEQSPFIHYDNQTLYFSSNGHLGMGQQDLFYTRKDSSGNWGKPVNLGYPINTFEEEVTLIINPKGDKAYYSSMKKPSLGGLDLFYFELDPKIRPNQVTFVSGMVYDVETSQKLSATLKLIRLSDNKQIATATSDPITGEYLICIPAGNDYAFHVSKQGYLFYSENFSLAGHSDSIKTFFFDIPLSPLKKGKKTVLKNIFFDYDSYEIKNTSLPELENLFAFMQKNETVKIEISGHTDNTGNENHNNELSLNRAKAVYEYLIEMGIQSNRLQFKGYGSKQPVDANNTEVGRSKNRRTEFKIL